LYSSKSNPQSHKTREFLKGFEAGSHKSQVTSHKSQEFGLFNLKFSLFNLKFRFKFNLKFSLLSSSFVQVQFVQSQVQV
jgi:hypothetical protein